MRPIDADVLLSKIKFARDKAISENDFVSAAICELFEKAVTEEPALDTDFCKIGKWIINSDGYYPYCSVCGEEPESGKSSNYCPNCGAMMKGAK